MALITVKAKPPANNIGVVDWLAPLIKKRAKIDGCPPEVVVERAFRYFITLMHEGNVNLYKLANEGDSSIKQYNVAAVQPVQVWAEASAAGSCINEL